MTLQRPKGTDDILPPASRRWHRLLTSWDDWAGRYGYEPISTPLLEATEVFERSVGETTEVVEKQMYTFTDRGGRSVTLRPEGTAPVIRAYLEAGLSGPAKFSYAGPMFRYEQPQAGRRRQFFQVGVEYVGEVAPEADAEVIELGYRYLDDLEMPDLAVQVNSIGDQVCRPGYLEDLRAYLGEHRDLLCGDCLRRMDTNPMRVLDCRTCSPKLADAPVPVDHLCEPCRLHYRRVLRVLDLLEVPYLETPRLVRGLDYYVRTAFEYRSGLDIAQDSVGGGGRYDGLSELLGGPPLPGVGFALGLDRVVLALEGTDQPGPIDLYVVVADRERFDQALELVSRWRREGLSVDLALENRSVKAQFRAADRIGASSAVVIGAELEDGKVTARRMETGDQELVAVDEVVAWAGRS